MDPSRRGFIKGLLASTTATSLVVSARPEEIAAFGKPLQGEVMLGYPEPTETPGLDRGTFIFNQYGQPLGIIDRVWEEHNDLDMTLMGSPGRIYKHGLSQVRLEAVIMGHFTMVRR